MKGGGRQGLRPGGRAPMGMHWKACSSLRWYVKPKVALFPAAHSTGMPRPHCPSPAAAAFSTCCGAAPPSHSYLRCLARNHSTHSPKSRAPLLSAGGRAAGAAGRVANHANPCVCGAGTPRQPTQPLSPPPPPHASGLHPDLFSHPYSHRSYVAAGADGHMHAAGTAPTHRRPAGQTPPAPLARSARCPARRTGGGTRPGK